MIHNNLKFENEFCKSLELKQNKDGAYKFISDEGKSLINLPAVLSEYADFLEGKKAALKESMILAEVKASMKALKGSPVENYLKTLMKEPYFIGNLFKLNGYYGFTVAYHEGRNVTGLENMEVTSIDTDAYGSIRVYVGLRVSCALVDAQLSSNQLIDQVLHE